MWPGIAFSQILSSFKFFLILRHFCQQHLEKAQDKRGRLIWTKKNIFILKLFSRYFRNFLDSMIKGSSRLISEKSPSKALKSRCRWPLSTTIFDRKEARNSPDQFSNVLFLKIKNFPEDVLSSGQSVLREIQSLNLYPPPKRRKLPILKSHWFNMMRFYTFLIGILVPMNTGIPAGTHQNFKILGTAGYRVPTKF